MRTFLDGFVRQNLGTLATDVNSYRFKKHIGNVTKTLQHEATKRYLGVKAVETLVTTSALLEPAIELPNHTIGLKTHTADTNTVPLWFSEAESVSLDPKTLITLGIQSDFREKDLTDVNMQALLSQYPQLFAVNMAQSSGVTVGFNQGAFMMVRAGLGLSDMTSVLCHELVHAHQIVRGDGWHEDDEVAAAMELEAYAYQAGVEKALATIFPTEFSLLALSGIAQKINYVRMKHSSRAAPYGLTTKMKQELREKNVLHYVCTKVEL